jgi:hypothetical protein
MNTFFTKSALASAIAFTIVACTSSGGGGGDTAGIGGSGFISTGSITGFGSVFVNGVEFDTDSATFDIEGTPGLQSDLAVGMVVKVNGNINDDGITGTADSISFDDELQGPVTPLPGKTGIIYDVDGVSATFAVLGTKVIIYSSGTTFDVDDDLPTSTVFDFDTIAVNNNIEISGYFDNEGTLQATRVELKDVKFDPNSTVEIEGVISNLNGTTFNLGSLIVDASAASLEDLPNGLQNSLLVEVEGTYDMASNTVTAKEVEAEDDSAEDTDEFEVEGIITDYINDSNFKVSGITVDASNLSLAAGTLMNDLLIEAEGPIIDGVLIADEIEFKGGDIKVHANVSSSNQATNSFEVEPLPGKTITVTINSGTQIEGDGIENTQEALAKLFGTPGFVEVRGVDDGKGGITAIEIDIKGSDVGEVEVQGFATAATWTSSTSGTITVLGVTFNFDGSTDFEVDSDVEGADDDDMMPAQIDALIADIQDQTTSKIVKIEDKKFPDGNPVGDADEIEIDSL